MTLRTLILPMVTAGLAVSTGASAHVPPPMIPTALVEDVKSATAEIEFMDYVGSGQVLKLEPGDVLVLSYLKSCEQETITGGTVRVGAEHSEVEDGQVGRAKVPCDGGKMRLTPQQASKSAAGAFRLQSADVEPTLYARTPMVQLPKRLASDSRTLTIERIDRPGERHELKIDETVTGGTFYDLANVNLTLARGAIYSATLDGRKMTFAIDPKAKSLPAPVVSRLLRFQ
jgi:hypothetical protein